MHNELSSRRDVLLALGALPVAAAVLNTPKANASTGPVLAPKEGAKAGSGPHS